MDNLHQGPYLVELRVGCYFATEVVTHPAYGYSTLPCIAYILIHLLGAGWDGITNDA